MTTVMYKEPRRVIVRLAEQKEATGRVIDEAPDGTLFVASEREYERAAASGEEPMTLGFAPEYVREA